MAGLDITPTERMQVVEDYASRVAAEEVKSQNMWEKQKQGVKGIADRCAAKIVSEEDRTYTVIPRRQGRNPKPRKQKLHKERVIGSHHSGGNQQAQQAVYPPDLGVAPPSIPFQMSFRTRRPRF